MPSLSLMEETALTATTRFGVKAQLVRKRDKKVMKISEAYSAVTIE